MSDQYGQVNFLCNDESLNQAFLWARRQALDYVFGGNLAGDWYEAALPGRRAFCMRDVAHACVGGQVLGLARHNKNMMRKFVQSIAESRDFCGFWEMDELYRPAPVDYASDDDFWYNLPANFDIIDACARLHLWTGDSEYLLSRDFQHFYQLSTEEYVRRWDHQGRGVMSCDKPLSRRGIASYDEEVHHPKMATMLDLVAAQICGYRAYASIRERAGEQALAEQLNAKAGQLSEILHNEWYDAEKKRYYTAQLQDGTMLHMSGDAMAAIFLHFMPLEDSGRLRHELDTLDQLESVNVECMSYLPELFFQHGQDERALKWLRRLTDPGLKRREYPEVSYSAMGDFAAGIMGVQPDSLTRGIRTRLCQSSQLAAAEMTDLPVFGGTVDIKLADDACTLLNKTGVDIRWNCVFRREPQQPQSEPEISRQLVVPDGQRAACPRPA